MAFFTVSLNTGDFWYRPPFTVTSIVFPSMLIHRGAPRARNVLGPGERTKQLENLKHLHQIQADWEYDGPAYALMDTDDFTLGLMMACWVKMIYREAEDR
ncbi:hypothetical protein EYF80_037099 [Liparis tanakae]|uniref:Uncharacterized protein n=1 Tax=Liparis tanakae TaxID=230148 RepID=A0A4Z2GH24_9TELE|nr:hypothetical protein EYF80_037099 [Liparis tanakae]